MIRRHILAVLALAPAAAHAQLGALDAARGAGRTSDAGNARIERAADAQLSQGEGQVRTSAPATRAAAPAGEPGLAVAPLEGGAASADQGRGTVPPPDTYTVRPGDTLWDLSGRFLNNPWYWPKIWSYNPDITNPHWISPGNVLKFYPSAEEAPGRVQPVDAAAPVAEAEPEEEEPRTAPALESFSRADINAPIKPVEPDGVAVAGPFKIGYVPPKQLMARHDTFVTPRELDESGAIKAAFDEKLMLTTLDRAYATFKQAAPVQKGETYVIYKTERTIQHPVTKELFGYQSVILGAAKVVAVDDKAVTLVITAANDPIERGAMLGPWTERFFRPVARKPNGRDLEGLIIASPVDVLTQFAEHQVVFIDRGTADGVEEGNVFNVVRSGDLSGRHPNTVPNDPSLPKETVGDLLVIDAREHASAALVTRSLSELLIGDHVEMRSAVAGAGGD
ncbi:LysM peptidoglycan-binding domain-containing protein [Anaeromyxobacter oryzae]|uniref:Peptidoglycan-binding protein n=1 Tax=Anaeromyxobacter oryzae TaxID=2918170 RepID=A0ABN6MZ65_9BACT|nr:LysM domain-containing protein [Anaeromyxobacter oryzae]BDG05926.1 peptidoglycan-binding protein [Anaeromyxobacter oryzae]